MRVGRPADPGLSVEDVGQADRERLVLAVEQIRLLVARTLLRALHGLGERGPEFLHLARFDGEFEFLRGRRIAALGLRLKLDDTLVGKEAEAEEFRDFCGDVVERRRLRRMRLLVLGEIRVERDVGAFLGLQFGEEGVVLRAREADRHAAGLVVREDDDKGFVRVFFAEVERDANRVVERNRVPYRGDRVVRVARPVDLAALNHHEEAVRIIQKLDPLRRELGERDFPVLAVDLVGKRLVPVKHGIDGHDLPRCRVQLQEVVARACDRVSGLRDGLEGVRLVALVAFGLLEAAAREEIEAALRELERDSVVDAPSGRVRVERRGRRVVDRHGRDDADLPARRLRELRDDRELSLALRVHRDDAGLRLLAARERRRRGRGVRDQGVRRIGRAHPLRGKLVHREPDDAGLRGVLFGREEDFGGVALRERHAVPDHEKDILRLRRRKRCGRKRQQGQNRKGNRDSAPARRRTNRHFGHEITSP